MAACCSIAFRSASFWAARLASRSAWVVLVILSFRLRPNFFRPLGAGSFAVLDPAAALVAAALL